MVILGGNVLHNKVNTVQTLHILLCSAQVGEPVCGQQWSHSTLWWINYTVKTLVIK